MIDIDRLMSDLDAINAIGRLPDGGNRRRALSPEDLTGRALLLEKMEAAGMKTRIDAAGNIVGRREPDETVGAATGEPESDAANSASRPAVLIGSHIDTIERGGRFDGVLGVFGALECIRTLNASGVAVSHPIEVVAFTDEEERFLGFLGSYAFTGGISGTDIVDCIDRDDVRLVDAMRAAGLDPENIAAARVDPAAYRAFVELHIEQGPILEREEKTIGAVEQVKGNYRWGVTITGQTDHAGAPLTGRRDAFMAMHEVVTRMIDFRNTRGDEDTTLTIGRIEPEPNIETAQPGTMSFSVDFRSPRREFLRAAETALDATLSELGETGAFAVEHHPILIENPVDFDIAILRGIRESAEARGYYWRALPSGAGHDAQVVGQHIPTAMIFVPSVDGRSHCPEEFTHTKDIEAGVNVLYDVMVGLASGRIEPGADSP